ncbi:hypothetical protein LCGC14_2831790, partial [marine sediment metagenome]
MAFDPDLTLLYQFAANKTLAPVNGLVDEGVSGIELPEIDALTGADKRASFSPLDAFDRAGKEWDLATELGVNVAEVRENFDFINAALDDASTKKALGSRPGIIRRGLKKFGRSFVNMLMAVRTKSQAGKLGIE